MNQLDKNEDTVSRQTPAVRMVEINEGDDHCLEVNYYSNNGNIEKKDNIMSMESVASHVAASMKNRIYLECPQTLDDVDNIEKIVDKCKDKEILITSSKAGLTGKLLEFTTKKCLEMEKNTILFRYEQEYSENPDEHPGIMNIKSQLNSFCCQVAHDKISLFPHFVQSLKAMKNQSMLIEVTMDDFKELFNAMNWKFDPEMINRGKDNIFKSSYITMVNLHADDDNNKYKMIMDEWDTDESDTESEDSYSSMSEDGYGTLSDSDVELSSEDEEPKSKKARLSEYAEDVNPATVTSFYIDEKDKLVLRDSFDGDKLRIYDHFDDISVYYSYIQIKGVSRDAAFNHIKESEKKFINLVDPQSMADLVHMNKITDLLQDKAFCIRSYMGEVTGDTRPLLKLVMKKCLENKNNRIVISYTKRNPEDEMSEWLSIDSELNNFSSEIFYERKSLFSSLVKSLKGLRNQSMEIIIEMDSEHKKLFEVMGWNYDEDMDDFLEKKSGFYDTEFDGDNNSYIFLHWDEEDKNTEESSVDVQMKENAKPTEAISSYAVEELEAALGTPYATTLVDAPALVGSGLLSQSSLDDPLAQPVQPNLDVFGRVPSEIRFPGLPAFYDQNTDTWWNGEQGWTWNHPVAGAPDAVEDI